MMHHHGPYGIANASYAGVHVTPLSHRSVAKVYITMLGDRSIRAPAITCRVIQRYKESSDVMQHGQHAPADSSILGYAPRSTCHHVTTLTSSP